MKDKKVARMRFKAFLKWHVPCNQRDVGES